MSDCPFCNLDPAPKATPPNPGSSKPPTGLLRRAWKTTQWLFPTALLVLIPKCPMCVAAYVMLFTGIGITVSTAHWIQILMWSFCVISFVYLAVRHNPFFRRSNYVHSTSHAR